MKLYPEIHLPTMFQSRDIQPPLQISDMSDKHVYYYFISYNVQELSYGPLTPYIQTCTTSHKITQA